MNNRESLITVAAYNATPNDEGSDFSYPPLSCQLSASKLTCLVGSDRTQLRAYLHMLAGIDNPTTGKVQIFGRMTGELNLFEWRKLRSQIGYLSGTMPLQSTQHGLMNVMLPALYHTNWSPKEVSLKARMLLSELDCQFDLIKFPVQLNSFQRLQLCLARALILDPALLILDLPFNDLDAAECDEMGMLLAISQKHRAVCMVDGFQHPNFLEKFADQIIFISEHKTINCNGWKSFSQSEEAGIQQLLSFLMKCK